MTYVTNKNNNCVIYSEISVSNPVNNDIASAQKRLIQAQGMLKERIKSVTEALEEQKKSFARFQSEMENLKEKIENLDRSARSCKKVTDRWDLENLNSYSRKLKSVV